MEFILSKNIVIIGGGIIGLTSAWYCSQRGHQVTVIDRNPKERDGCSFGNAGMIVPSHFTPLAAPGMIKLGLKWMWNPESPFYIRPRASWDLLTWLWQFRNACNSSHVKRSAPLLRDLHLASRVCFQELASDFADDFSLTPNGLLMLCQSKQALEEEAETAKLANSLNVEAQVLDAQATAKKDPSIEMNVAGSVYYPRDCHLSPHRLMSCLQSNLSENGCRFLWNTDCNKFQQQGRRVSTVETSEGSIDADEFIICGGVWSSELGRQLQLNLPMQAGKGYSVTLEQPCQQPSICSILTEARVAVTPMGSSLRFGGTMEISGLNQSISQSRVRGIIRSIPEYFPKFDPTDFEQCKPWTGLRPCSPDGLPYVGRSEKWENVIVSTGHAMMGISLAPITGRCVAEIADGQPSDIAGLELLSPDRYSS